MTVIASTGTTQSSQFGVGTASVGWFRRLEDEALHNEVLNRCAIDMIGYEPWIVGFARNGAERLEKVLDGLTWYAVGLAVPLVLQKYLSKRYENALAKHFKLPQAKGLVDVPLEWLSRHSLKDPAHADRLAQRWKAAPHQVEVLAKRVLRTKVAIVGVDMLFLMSQGALYFWGRNWLTERMTKKKGFAGELTKTTDTQRQDSNVVYDKHRKRNQLLSGLAWVIGVLGLPALMLGTLLPKGASRLLERLKKHVIPKLNYHNTIYMSKWVIFWSTIFNYNIMGYLAARSPNEKREHIVKQVILDVMLYLGDAVFAGIAGSLFQKKHAAKLQGVRLFNKTTWGLPYERPLNDILKDPMVEQAIAKGDKALPALVDKLGRYNFRIGIVATALILGIGTTVANNYYTGLKLLDEQKRLVKGWLPLFQQSGGQIRSHFIKAMWLKAT